jgi:hypothetical protein
VEGASGAGLGQAKGRQRASTKEVKKGRREEKTLCEVTDASTAVLDLSVPVLLAQPISEEDCIKETAERIRQRHPAARRCSRSEAIKHLRAIVGRVPAQERAARLASIEANHAGWCRSVQWQKDGGAYVNGLGNWLAPTMGRFDNEPPPPANPGSSVLPTQTQQIADNLRRIHGKG